MGGCAPEEATTKSPLASRVRALVAHGYSHYLYRGYALMSRQRPLTTTRPPIVVRTDVTDSPSVYTNALAPSRFKLLFNLVNKIFEKTAKHQAGKDKKNQTTKSVETTTTTKSPISLPPQFANICRKRYVSFMNPFSTRIGRLCDTYA